MFSQWAIILPWRSRTWVSSPIVHRSGIRTIVTSSMAESAPMPLRRASSPEKWPGFTSDGSWAGADSANLPVAGDALRLEGATPPVSSILTSFDDALTFVAMLLRPFLSVRPSYSSLSLPEVTTSL